MASTNQTSNLELSQFIGSDSPKWLTDYNSDMEKIDAGYGSVKAQADATDLTVSGHTASITSLTDTVGDQTAAIQNIRTDVTANTGSINTINSLIGNGEPTTTDKTIIGAINEIYADITGSGDDVEAENVSYNNTTSGLTATDVQAAIDEIAGSGFEYVELASVTADGVKTMPQLLTELDALMNADKWNKVEYLQYVNDIYQPRELAGSGSFVSLNLSGGTGNLNISEIRVKTHVRIYGELTASGYTPTPSDTSVITSGAKITIYGRP